MQHGSAPSACSGARIRRASQAAREARARPSNSALAERRLELLPHLLQLPLKGLPAAHLPRERQPARGRVKRVEGALPAAGACSGSGYATCTHASRAAARARPRPPAGPTPASRGPATRALLSCAHQRARRACWAHWTRGRGHQGGPPLSGHDPVPFSERRHAWQARTRSLGPADPCWRGVAAVPAQSTGSQPTPGA